MKKMPDQKPLIQWKGSKQVLQIQVLELVKFKSPQNRCQSHHWEYRTTLDTQPQDCGRNAMDVLNHSRHNANKPRQAPTPTPRGLGIHKMLGQCSPSLMSTMFNPQSGRFQPVLARLLQELELFSVGEPFPFYTICAGNFMAALKIASRWHSRIFQE